jgi:hypothetical protein
MPNTLPAKRLIDLHLLKHQRSLLVAIRLLMESHARLVEAICSF